MLGEDGGSTPARAAREGLTERGLDGVREEVCGRLGKPRQSQCEDAPAQAGRRGACVLEGAKPEEELTLQEQPGLTTMPRNHSTCLLKQGRAVDAQGPSTGRVLSTGWEPVAVWTMAAVAKGGGGKQEECSRHPLPAAAPCRPQGGNAGARAWLRPRITATRHVATALARPCWTCGSHHYSGINAWICVYLDTRSFLYTPRARKCIPERRTIFFLKDALFFPVILCFSEAIMFQLADSSTEKTLPNRLIENAVTNYTLVATEG